LPVGHRAHLFTSLTLGLALGVYLLAPSADWACTRVEGWWFGLGEALCVLSAGALVLGSICLVVPAASSLADSVKLTLALALLCQTACLVANGLGAQLAWGAYWSWDPVECWRIASWLVTAMACVSLRPMDSDPHRARWAFLATTGFALATLLGALPLVGLLRLGSLYLAP
jgi:ABC-type transport system involved in cytochrome c biogenesis permease subunit